MPSTTKAAASAFIFRRLAHTGKCGGLNRCLSRLGELLPAGADRWFLPPTTLDPPGQRLKLPLGPVVETRRPSPISVRWRGNREIWTKISNLEFLSNCFSGCGKFPNKDRTPQYFVTNLQNMLNLEICFFDENNPKTGITRADCPSKIFLR